MVGAAPVEAAAAAAQNCCQLSSLTWPEAPPPPPKSVMAEAVAFDEGRGRFLDVVMVDVEDVESTTLLCSTLVDTTTVAADLVASADTGILITFFKTLFVLG